MTKYRLIQVSDTHLTPGRDLFHGVHPGDNLRAGLGMLSEAGIVPDLLVLTGDLANTGDPECYEELRAVVAGFVDNGGTTVVYLPGNHDLRPEFRRHLLGQEASDGPINQVHWRGGLRVVSLDTVVPGDEAGALAAETLAFLRDALSTVAPDGTVLALHHPPIPSPVEPMARIMLHHPEQLGEAIVGSDVRVVLCGHNHHDALGSVAGVPVWVSPSSAYRIDILSRDKVHGVPGCAFSQIDLYEGGTTATVIPVPLP